MKPAIFLYFIFLIITFTACKDSGKTELPSRGLCAHRGAPDTHPENTIPSFEAAINAGAHMIEFDVWLTKDNKMVVIHDSKVNRTTNGQGKVSDFTFEGIRKLDAGSWKSAEFAGIQIPALEEVIDIMPYNIWLNIHIKGSGELPKMVARMIKEKGRLYQAFMACNATSAQQAKEAVPEIMICNMERQDSTEKYVDGTIELKTEFIQLLKSKQAYTGEQIKRLKENGVKINYYKADSPEEVKELFNDGIDFPLVNDIIHYMEIAKQLKIHEVKPIFKTKQH